MRIALIRPPRLFKRYSRTFRPAPPLGLAYIAGALSHSGHSVKVIDAMAEDPSCMWEFRKDIVGQGITNSQVAALIPADIEAIGISCMFTGNWLHTKTLIQHLKEQFPAAVIFAGGEHITAAFEVSMRQCPSLDICVLGEGEETVIDLFSKLQNRASIESVAGIVYRSERGEIRVNPRRKRIADIEAVPAPDWSLFPVRKYFESGIRYGVGTEPLLPIVATRGCPYACTFCSNPSMYGHNYYMRSVQHVVDEIENLIQTYGVTSFDFYDLTAILKKSWIIALAQEILRRNLKITWQIPAGTRSEVIDAEVASHLFKAGCKNITYAPESGSERILKLTKKRVNLSNMLHSIRLSHKEKLNVKINIILGFPEETHRDIWKTILFLVKCSWAGVYDAVPATFQPYPGSEIFNKLLQEKKINLEGEDYYLQILEADNFYKIKFYNENVSQGFLRIYNVIYLLAFYFSNYLFRPQRLFFLAKNVLLSSPRSRGESFGVEIINQLKESVRRRFAPLS